MKPTYATPRVELRSACRTGAAYADWLAASGRSHRRTQRSVPQGTFCFSQNRQRPRRGRCPNTSTATLVRASQRVGLILPGMIKEPGSFSGIFNSAKPVRSLVGRHSFLRSCIRGWLRRHSLSPPLGRRGRRGSPAGPGPIRNRSGPCSGCGMAAAESCWRAAPRASARRRCRMRAGARSVQALRVTRP